MKQHLILLICVTLLGACSKGVLLDELTNKGTDKSPLMYYKGKLFNGLAFETDEHDVTVTEADYKDGKLNGLYREFYDEVEISNNWYKVKSMLISQSALEGASMAKSAINEELWWEDLTYLNRSDPKINGWYKDKQMKVEINYIDGVKNGLYKSWYKNNQIKKEIKFTDGKKDWMCTWYEYDGHIKEASYFKDGKLFARKKWYENETTLLASRGWRKEYIHHYKNGKKNGEWIGWYENGWKKYKYNFKDGKRDGLWQDYDCGVNSPIIRISENDRSGSDVYVVSSWGYYKNGHYHNKSGLMSITEKERRKNILTNKIYRDPDYRFPHTIIYRQHAINDDGMYANRNIRHGRECNTHHITRKKEEVEKCTEMNILLYVRFVNEDSIVVRRFYSDAAFYVDNIEDTIKKLGDNDLLPFIYSKTECDEISLKETLSGAESLKFREVINSQDNTNSNGIKIAHNFELNFVKYSNKSANHRLYLNGFEIDNEGNKHQVAFINNFLSSLYYEDCLFLENWDEEWAWIEGRNGRWYYENFGD